VSAVEQELAEPTDLVEEEPYEEDEDIALRERLGLRPIHYAQDGQDHPDGAPCPDWCWIRQYPDYDHEVDSAHPFKANHALEPSPSFPASLYRGWHDHRPNEKWYVHPATLEVNVRAVSKADPVVTVALRQVSARSHLEFDYDPERLRLSVDDARELITALTYVCDVIDGKVDPS
jgi:hypothetical protein